MEDASDTIFEATTSMKILNHLTDKYDFDPVQPSHLINKFGYSMSLQGRDELLQETKKLYDTRWGNQSTKDRNVHKVGIIGGCSGIGKSRALIEIANSIQYWKTAAQWSFEIVISYNNGNPPTTDRRLFESRASTALALRLLYYSFVANKKFGISFETFVSSFPRVILDVLTPEIAIEAIGSYMSDRNGNEDGVIFIGLDEANYLLDPGYTGEEEKRTFLKQTLIALGSIMLLHSRFVFAVVAGTTVLPIHTVFSQSGLQIQPLPIKLLRGEHCETIVAEMASMALMSSSWAQWRTCRAFRTLLADFGSMPRQAEELLRYVNDEVSIGTALVEIDYHMIYCRLIGTHTPSTMSAKLAERIVSDIMLGTHIRRDELVDSLESSFTYGALESLGMLVLETSVDTHLTVKMPYSQFRLLVQKMDGSDTLTKSLRKICVQMQHEGFGLNWQNFEDLHCHVEASREMLIARREPDRPCSVEDFYCVANAPNDFDFVLRRCCDVVTSASRFPSQAWGVLVDNDPLRKDTTGKPLNGSTSYIKNAPGAAFDSFTKRNQNR